MGTSEWEDDSTSSCSFMVTLFVLLMITCTLSLHQNGSCFISSCNHEGQEGSDFVALPFITWYLSFSGDVEVNPGPDLLLEKQLEALKLGQELSDRLPNTICNKHIYQLYQMKKSDRSLTWNGDVIFWIMKLKNILVNDLPSGNAVQKQWDKLVGQRKEILKNIKRVPNGLKEWEEREYHIPISKPLGPRTTTYGCAGELVALKGANQSLAKELEEIKTEKETLQLRPSPHKQAVQSRRERRYQQTIQDHKVNITRLEKESETQKQQIAKAKTSKRRLSLEVDKIQKKVAKLENEKTDIDHTIQNEQEKVHELKNDILNLKEANAHLQNKLDENESNIVHLTEIKDGCKMYTPDARLCVYQLLSHHVSFENVGPVIQTVLAMIGKTPDQVPSRVTVSHMNDERLLLAQKQLGELATKKNLTLSTDETPKEGDIYMTYTITDEDDNSYVLGLREMISKSAEDTLTTLKVILDDLTEVCSFGNDTGLKILCQIKNTMSDRAATETKFNAILKTYRETCLPLYHEGWDRFSNAAKSKLIEMNNFFCGLHLLVSMAETIGESFKQFEEIQFDGKKFGASCAAGVKVFGSDSGTIRLVRTACKALAKGADEKSGCHRAWNTYLRTNGITKRYLQNFRGNRFNIVFLLGGCVFHLRDHVWEFLNCVHGQPNGLLRAVHADMQVDLYLSGCKVLGILNKLITAPLWRITEESGHILSMCDQYTKLDTFLGKCLQSDDQLGAFVRMESSCFDDKFISKDEVFDSLAGSTKYDEMSLNMMKHTLAALKQLIGRVTKEYLPGGQYHLDQANPSFRKETESVPKHNKLPERVFGYLGYLIGRRPNARAIANEAQIMYVFNKTSEYIASLAPNKIQDLIHEVTGKSRKTLRTKMKERENQLHEELVKKQMEKKAKLEQAKKNQVKQKEDLTGIIIDAGLWQSPETVDEKMNQCTSDRERYEACKKQIKFRRNVLNQFIEEDKKFNFTEEGKPKPWTAMRDHLLLFINAALSVREGQSVQKNTPDMDSVVVPLLVGKKVNHWFVSEDGDREPYVGKVISQVPGFPQWFNITYDDDDAVYSYKLVEDYSEGNLEIIPQ